MRLVLTIAACLIAAPLYAQDVEGSKDHPLVSRFPGYRIENYDANDFGSHEFTIGDGKTKTVEGKYWSIGFVLNKGAKKGGPLEIVRNDANAFTKQGGVKLLEDMDPSGGTMTARLKGTWMEMQVNNGGEGYTVTIVEEAAMTQKVEYSAAELAAALKDKGSVALYGILFDTHGIDAARLTTAGLGDTRPWATTPPRADARRTGASNW